MTRIGHLANRNSRAGSRRGGMRTKLGIETLEPRCMLSVNVTTWHNDLTRQGLNNSETVLTPANVNSSSFGKLFSYSVTGQIYASPLYVSNLNMGALGTHNVVFVATEDNDVYAFDAVNNGAGGGLLWHSGPSTLGTAAPLPSSFIGPSGYTDITTQVGITSTPVIDLATNTMYLDAFTNPSSGVYQHHIWALDITTGLQKVAPKLVAASIQGTNPADSSGGVVTFTATQALQRSALTLLNGVVYAAYASYGDDDPYHGWILGFDASNLNLVKVFNATPNLTSPEDTSAGRGGIWQAGAGLASDGTHLYFMTGNGDFDASVGDYGDSFVELTPDSSTQPTNKNGYGLSVTDYFTPWDEQSLSTNDTDLGSAGPLLLPDQPGSHTHEMIGAGKGLKMYVVDRDNMGGHIVSASGPDTNIVQTVTVNRAPGSQAYFNGMVYFHGYNSAVLKAYQVSNGTLSAAAVASGAAVYQFPGATPEISSYGNSANGIVWETQYSSTNAVLRAYNAVPSGSNLTELYNSGAALGAGIKFTVPTVADGHVYVGLSGSLAVFGLTSNPNAAPSAPTNLNATVSTVPSLKVNLTWTDNANNENAFKILRSTDGTNYTQIDVASVNSTSYTDTSVAPGTMYYYQVVATNPISDSSPASFGPVTTPALAPPVLFYHFDEGTGTFAADSGSAGTNTGVLVGTTKPSWVAGQIGASALSFSGNGAYNQTNQSAVQVTSNLIIPLGTTSTLTAWVKTTQTGSNNHQQAPAITGVDQQGTTSDINWGTLNASGRIGLYVGDTGGIYSTSPINDGQWHNVAMTRDATTGAVQLYIDGLLNNSSSFDTGTKAAQFYLIGALTDRNSSGYVTGANYFNGQLDDVRIYNRVLSAPEISQIGSAPGAAADLSASAIPDSSSMTQLSWTNRSDTAQSIQVERKTGASGAYQPIAILDGTETKYFDTDLQANTEYFYRIQASGSAGSSDYSNEASCTTFRPEIVWNSVFYNGSKYDFQNSSSNFLDGFSTATDKQALLPGQTATFQNYTSYSKGINGIAIDIANWEGSITRDDYELRVGNSSDISTWVPAPEPDLVTEYLGAGVGGSTRLELVWDDNVIQNEWVQVTLKANANTGIAVDDVFYFGNSIGDTGNSPTDGIVDGADVLGAQNNQTATAGITNLYDFNRNKVVDATDVAIAQANQSGASPLILFTAPGGTPGAGSGLENESVAHSSESSVRSADQTVPLEPPASQSVVTASPLKFAAAFVPASTPDRSKSVDAVFANHEHVSVHADFAASLLNLESHHTGTPASAKHNDAGDSHHWRASSDSDDLQATCELIADDFAHMQVAASTRSLAKRR